MSVHRGFPTGTICLTLLAGEWPAFDGDRRFIEWKLLQQNVLGEFQWRLVFRENGLGTEAARVAAGWGADRYAIFENRRTGEPLMLMHTSWDTDADAREFAQAYRRVLETKYSAHPTPTTLRETGREVLVVEGAEDRFAAALMAFMERAPKTRPESDDRVE